MGNWKKMEMPTRRNQKPQTQTLSEAPHWCGHVQVAVSQTQHHVSPEGTSKLTSD